MAAVSIRNLSITLAGTSIIEDLSLEVASGEFLVLLGPSGCGKSTLLNGIAGLTDVASGTVVIGGEDVTAADPADRDIGMVFQSYALYPTMTVAGNLSFGLRVRGVSRDQIEARVYDESPKCCTSTRCSGASLRTYPVGSASESP